MPKVTPDIEQSFAADARTDQERLADLSAQTSQIRTPLVTRETKMPAFDADLGGRMMRQQQLIRDGQYTPIGTLERIQLEASGIPLVLTTTEGARVPNPLVNDKSRTASLDWMKQGPLLGLSLDGRELLVIPPVFAPPPIPDPTWIPPALHDGRGNYKPGVIKPGDAHVPKVKQELIQFAWGACQIGADNWMVFQPIHEMLLIGITKGMGTAREAWSRGDSAAHSSSGFMTVAWTTGMDDRQCMLLFDPIRHQAHILGGSFRIQEF